VIQENEIVMLILGGGVFIFTLVCQMRIKRIPEWQILVLGFYFLLAGWILTVIEGFFWRSPLNYLEHLSYACSSTLMAVWCWRVVFGGKQGTKL